MIDIKNNYDCCGCGACEQICPKKCIVLSEDQEGFVYPNVDKDICIDCGLCEKACPVINEGVEREPLHVYGAMNKNEEIRLKSSSGGIFTILAEQTIADGGVVFGARFNEKWEVQHNYTEIIEGIEALSVSKYVQSHIGNSYKEVEQFLKSSRKVLFVGTPCQVAGLKRFLRKDYENLLLVDFICHGVPSPKVWRMYLDELIRTKCGVGKNSVSLSLNEISNISFRDKSNGWKKYGFRIWSKSAFKADINTVSEFGITLNEESIVYSELFSKNIYMRGFLTDLTLRPSCYKCSAKSGRSGSDITIADFWSIQLVAPEFDDDKGVGLVLVNTPKGRERYPLELTSYIDTTTDERYKNSNGGFKSSLKIHPKRSQFFNKIDSGILMSELISIMLKKRFATRVTRKIKHIIKHILKQ